MASRAYNKAYYEANKERLKAAARARSAKRRLEKPEECKAAVEKWHKDPANAERRRAYFREVAAKSEAWARAQKKYRYSQKGVSTKNACVRAYYMRRDRRMPSWLNADQLDQIKSMYRLANIASRTLGWSFHVDHIVPLRGERVSGLHVPWNLSVIPEEENIRKGNTFEVN